MWVTACGAVCCEVPQLSTISFIANAQVKRHFAALWEREQHVMSLARHGFAQRYRPYLWMLLAGIDLAGAMSSPASGSSGVSGCGPAFCISTHKAAFDATLNLKSDEYEEQTILRDIDRTFPDHEFVR